MVKIKTFPIQFVDSELKELHKIAKKDGSPSLKDWIHEAIKEKKEKHG